MILILFEMLLQPAELLMVKVNKKCYRDGLKKSWTVLEIFFRKMGYILRTVVVIFCQIRNLMVDVHGTREVCGWGTPLEEPAGTETREERESGWRSRHKSFRGLFIGKSPAFLHYSRKFFFVNF